MPPACFLNAPTDSHDSDIGHCLGMTVGAGDPARPPGKCVSLAVPFCFVSLPRFIIRISIALLFHSFLLYLA